MKYFEYKVTFKNNNELVFQCEPDEQAKNVWEIPNMINKCIDADFKFWGCSVRNGGTIKFNLSEVLFIKGKVVDDNVPNFPNNDENIPY